MTIQFSAVHNTFYKDFEVWRKDSEKDGLPISGVYKLVADKPIGRLLGDDNYGVLYIGKGVILSTASRVGKFINALNNTESRHNGGIRLNAPNILNKFPIENLKVEITLTESPEELESNLLHQYNEEFGEMPPFNRRMEFTK